MTTDDVYESLLAAYNPPLSGTRYLLLNGCPGKGVITSGVSKAHMKNLGLLALSASINSSAYAWFCRRTAHRQGTGSRSHCNEASPSCSLLNVRMHVTASS